MHEPRNTLLMQVLEGNAWHADHIVPVYAGGGMCQLDNLRTLCVPCHQVSFLRPSLLPGLVLDLKSTYAQETSTCSYPVNLNEAACMSTVTLPKT